MHSDEHILDVSRINKSLEDLINEIAAYREPGDIINLSYSLADIKITIK